ncbi:MAG: hypothetical protein O7C59_06590 [Rickettsia endosymbiont of Ixodes persulcatus]|nr:hypothetical protein [Rickettsia endosymbiont of Ixodes persulcatus]MCZ6902961.1 hypothetical protein [Rickettsia endosymbiont of Ixodes persulcatus]MCZ6908951.1 hypothetical protein [Rickettsia endosymbiont of Ixodes persulcatus]MCZ6910546.1 hypothetical protein [Rickettsia endosymbiont of Ixodes persulcatus]MCZ6914146.1 hypothetical protein [Rickettsia endosymbiont of Ixodes persulcatus]
MHDKTIKERIAIIEPYLDFIIKDQDLLRKIYPNGIGRKLTVEFILARKPYNSYAYYKLISILFKLPCQKIILIINRNLLKSSLSLFHSIILGTLSYLNLVKIFLYD